MKVQPKWHRRATAEPPGAASEAGLIVFLLAHQDDELMLTPIIADAKREGRSVAVVVLTNGDGGRASPSVRNEESARLLSWLGVSVSREVEFLGHRLAISDGQLFRKLMAAHSALIELLEARKPIELIYVHAWEGGNPDHDAAHALGIGVATALGLRDAVYQVPFYRAPQRGPLPFVLFSPLEANGPTAYYRLGLRERLGHLLQVRFFPSQLRTFIKFWPFMFLHALLRPGVPVQSADPTRVRERPTQEPLRYERIGYVEFSTMAPLIASYLYVVSRSAVVTRPCECQAHQ